MCLLLDAAVAARRVSHRCAQLALAGSGIGALFAALGPPIGAAGRAAIAVHTAALIALGVGVWSGMALGRHPDPVLPALLQRVRPLPASLFLGGVWAGWHLPLILTSGAALDGSPFLDWSG